MSYVDTQTEIEILEQHENILRASETIEPVCTRSEVLNARRAAMNVYISHEMREAIVNITQATRTSDLLQFGASTRAALMLQKALRGWALVNGRDYTTEDDLKTMLPYVLLHRVKFHAGIDNAERSLFDLATPFMEKLIAAKV